MSKVVVIGAGFAGHTAAMYLGDALGRDHEITVINMSDRFLFTASLIWVGVGHMDVEKTRFPLEAVYNKLHVNFIHGMAIKVHPDEQYVIAEKRGAKDGSGLARVEYDYLIIATGPRLNFEGTPGLGPEIGNTYSICTAGHAVQCRDAYLESVERMKRGEKQKILIGVGHPGSTCQGAAFEYVANVHKDLLKRGVRDKADLVYISNERALGDFGVGGIHIRQRGRMISSQDFMEAVFKEYNIQTEMQRGVRGVKKGRVYWEDYDGNQGETDYDFAMLIPQFTGMPIKYIGKDGKDVSNLVVSQTGFVLVDGIYGQSYEQLCANPDSWPAVYQNPDYRNIFAAGIAFAPPGPISIPHKTPNGLSITSAPPRTAMMSGIMGRVVAMNIIDLVKRGRMTHSERMTEMFAVCIASMGDSLWDGSAAVIVTYPVVPDHQRYPDEEGRDLFVTHMEMGLAGAWMKRMIHTTFMHKLQGRVGWKLIPE